MVSNNETLRQEIYLWKFYEVMSKMLFQQDEVAKVAHCYRAPAKLGSTEAIAHILINWPR